MTPTTATMLMMITLLRMPTMENIGEDDNEHERNEEDFFLNLTLSQNKWEDNISVHRFLQNYLCV
jgi:hypothetical protein